MTGVNKSWNLESFLDSLIVELDKARDTLAVKGINKPLTYTVKDVNLEMQLFPSYDGRDVRFVTAKPGETGASKIAIQLASITDDQIRKTTRDPVGRDDITLEEIPDIDEETKQDLRKVGVASVKDLVKMENRNVDLRKVNRKGVDYGRLASLLRRARRGESPPEIRRAAMSMETGLPILKVHGNNLRMDKNYQPVVVIDGELAHVVNSDRRSLEVHPHESWRQHKNSEMILVLDPYTLCRFKIGGQQDAKVKKL